MANMFLTSVLFITLTLICVIETRSVHKLNSLVIPENWKRDKNYNFEWIGAFAYGLPVESRCAKVFQPDHGRFICSTGTLVKRNMCLVECKKGFEQIVPPVVYICENGIWKDLTHQPIATPEPHCVPRTDNLKSHFPK